MSQHTGHHVAQGCSAVAVPAQFVREFAKLGLTRTVGGVLGLALARELTPVVTSIILAGAVTRSVCSGGMVDVCGEIGLVPGGPTCVECGVTSWHSV